MLIRYFKGDPSHHVVAVKNGKTVREGIGASFFYVPHTTNLIVVPVSSRDAQFVIQESTSDYQDVTVQGSLTYRISEPSKAAKALDFTFDPRSGQYKSNDMEKLQVRIVNALQSKARPTLRQLSLEESLRIASHLSTELTENLRNDDSLSDLGIHVESVYVVRITATPEMKKALEADFRESLNRRADQAIYARRAAAVEEERKLREAELDTEIEVETRRKSLVESESENKLRTAEADAEAEKLRLSPYLDTAPTTLAMVAFRDWAATNPNIGQLNLTPEVLTAVSNWIGQSQTQPEKRPE